MKKRALFLSLALTVSLFLSLACPAGAAEYTAVAPMLSAGTNYSLAVDADGTLWGWGSNYRGQLGNVEYGNVPTEYGNYQTYPTPVGEGVRMAAAGNCASAVLSVDGSVWIFGTLFGDYGGEPHKPVKLMDGVASIAMDRHVDHSGAAIKTDGTLWLWGANYFGQLAPGGVTGDFSSAPVQVMDGVAQVSMDGGSVMALKTDGTLWTWGDDSYGILGSKGVGDDAEKCRATPVQIMDGVRAVSNGMAQATAVRQDGTLWAWGRADVGVLGPKMYNEKDSLGNRYQSVPLKVMDGVLDSESAGFTCYIIKEDRALWVSGQNYFGQAGTGSDQGTVYPAVKLMDGVAEVAGGGNSFVLARKLDGSVWQWGGEESNVPVQLTLSGKPITITKNAIAVTPGLSELMVDGQKVSIPVCTGYDARGGATSYVRLRDVASVVNGSAAQFSVGYNKATGTIALTHGEAYTPDGSEQRQIFTENQWATSSRSPITVNGAAVDLAAITLTDAKGGYNYLKLRDLGAALGFNVGWSAEKGIFIETDKPYTGK